MKLTSFQVINCFGFINSGKVDLLSLNNLIYILGRNSSGKSSLLNAIRYLEQGIKPSEQPNFQNFAPSELSSYLSAEFSLETESIDFQKFKDDLEQILPSLNFAVVDKTDDEALGQIITIYENAIKELNEDKKCIVLKFASGNYYFARLSDTNSYGQRKKEIQSIVGDADFNSIENLIFNQFPKVYLFNQEHSLNDSLPDIINIGWRNKTNDFEKLFVEYIGSKDIDRILTINDPKERTEIIGKLNTQVKLLTDRINENRSASDDADLLEVFLDVASGGGVQITIYTDGKPSFYSHLSENTKFLFAYHLYQVSETLTGNILLFDEPNNGFHPTAQKMLLRFLQQLGENGNLIIVTTHSEHLIDIDYLANVRLMSADNNKNSIVKNCFYNQPKESGDYFALQPIFDAIGYKYGSQLSLRHNAILVEGVTDLLYLRAFNKMLNIANNLNIAPARSDSTMLPIIPFLISQGVNFKIVIDTGKVKNKIKDSFGIAEKFFYEIPVPSLYARANGSGIEDLFTKSDFKKILTEAGHKLDPQFNNINNSVYMNLSKESKLEKRLVAENLYRKADLLSKEEFDNETIENFRSVLTFCDNSDWFSL